MADVTLESGAAIIAELEAAAFAVASHFGEAMSEIPPKSAAGKDAAQRWIPTAERMPQSGIRVMIAWRGYPDVHVGIGVWSALSRQAALDPPQGWSTHGLGGVTELGDSVTHWMPLPEPPHTGNLCGSGNRTIAEHALRGVTRK